MHTHMDMHVLRCSKKPKSSGSCVKKWHPCSPACCSLIKNSAWVPHSIFCSVWWWTVLKRNFLFFFTQLNRQEPCTFHQIPFLTALYYTKCFVTSCHNSRRGLLRSFWVKKIYIYMGLIRVSFGVIGISGVGTSAVNLENENIHDGRYITSMMVYSLSLWTAYYTWMNSSLVYASAIMVYWIVHCIHQM